MLKRGRWDNSDGRTQDVVSFVTYPQIHICKKEEVLNSSLRTGWISVLFKLADTPDVTVSDLPKPIYLIFVIFSPQTQFLAQFFSTQKCVTLCSTSTLFLNSISSIGCCWPTDRVETALQNQWDVRNLSKRGIVMLWKDLLIQMNQIRFKGIVSQFLFFWIFGYYIGVWYSLVWLEGSSINIQLTVLEQKFWDWEDTLPMLGKFPNNPILVFRILPWVAVYLYSDMAREIWAGIFSKLRGAWKTTENPVLTDTLLI